MDDTSTEVLESLETPVADQTAETNETDSADALTAANVQKAKWREKAIKAEELSKKLEAQLARVKPQETSQFATKEEVADMQLHQLGYDSDTIAAIKTFARGSGKSPLEVLNDEPVKLMLQAQKQKTLDENSIPDSSNRTITLNGKSIAEMTKAERQANWGEIVKKSKK